MIKNIKNFLYSSQKICVGRSMIHGWGVFATDDISSDEILEEVAFLVLPMERGDVSSLFIDYRFNYPKTAEWKYQVLPLGSGCLYNHSNEPNAEWVTDEENEIFVFRSIKDIKKGDEILVYYGDINYWNDGRGKTKVK